MFQFESTDLVNDLQFANPNFSYKRKKVSLSIKKGSHILYVKNKIRIMLLQEIKEHNCNIPKKKREKNFFFQFQLFD